MSQRGDGRSSDRKWSHIGKVSTSQDSIFRGEHGLQVYDVFHGFVCSEMLYEKVDSLRRKTGISLEKDR